MRQIRSFINLVHHLMKISCFKNHNNYCAYNDSLAIQRSNKQNFINITITITNKNGSIQYFYHVQACDVLYDEVNVSVKSFGNKYQQSRISLLLEDESDYFNYNVLNNTGKLTLEDIEVLKNIKTLANDILNA